MGRKDTHINPQLKELSDIFAVAVGDFSVMDIDHGCFGSARCLLGAGSPRCSIPGPRRRMIRS